VAAAIVATAVMIAAIGAGLLAYRWLTSDPAVGLETEARAGNVSLWISYPEWLAHDHTADATRPADGSASLDGSIGEGGSSEGSGTADAAEDGPDQVAAALSGSQGFAMPQSMMPGTPDEGFHRLQVNLDFSGHGPAEVNPADFALVANDGQRWAPNLGGIFAATQIDAGQAFATIISFDIPVSVTGEDVLLVWDHADTQIDFALEGGEGHTHG